MTTLTDANMAQALLQGVISTKGQFVKSLHLVCSFLTSIYLQDIVTPLSDNVLSAILTNKMPHLEALSILQGAWDKTVIAHLIQPQVFRRGKL
jgi:hypothetical protein